MNILQLIVYLFILYIIIKGVKVIKRKYIDFTPDDAVKCMNNKRLRENVFIMLNNNAKKAATK